MTTVTFDDNGLAITDGTVTVYNYDPQTGEFISSADEFLPIGTGIPAHSAIDAPPKTKNGFAICRTADLSDWEYVEDHRGETIYSTATGELITIAELGDYPANTTTTPPATQYDKWDGKKWVTNEMAQHDADVITATNQRTALTVVANAAITPLMDAVDLGIATEAETALLNEWRRYRVLLNRVDVSILPVTEWPIPPGKPQD